MSMNIKWSMSDYDGYGGYHAMMLIGDCQGYRFVTSYRDFSIWTPLSLRFAKWKIKRRFKALLT